MNNREEAVLRLENIKPFVGENVKEALDMAIEELKKKPCEDAVSRNELIQIVNKHAYPIVYGVNNHDFGMTINGIKQTIMELTPVQPVALVSSVRFDGDKLKELVEEAVSGIEVEYCWHPVSEAPKKDGDYLVSVVDEFGKRVISSYYSSVTGWVTIYDVEAWMEQPKVYEGG